MKSNSGKPIFQPNKQRDITGEKFGKEILDECTESEDAVCYITNVDATALEMSIKALEDVQQYRQIGTVEECRAAVEKQTAAKPLGGMDADGNDYAICRECSAILSDGEWFAQYCPDCGKKVDWSDENEQRT